MTQILTTIAALKVVAPMMSTEETRYYLKGVLFQKDLMIAMDGHRLAAVKAAEFEGSADPEFILPAATVKKVCGVKPDKKETLYLRIDSEAKTAEVISLFGSGNIKDAKDVKGEFVLASFPFTPVDGTFPDWRRVIPGAEHYDTPAAFSCNSKYLAAFQSFGRNITLFPNNDAGAPSIVRAQVADTFDAIGVIMPTRGDTDAAIVPAWVR